MRVHQSLPNEFADYLSNLLYARSLTAAQFARDHHDELGFCEDTVERFCSGARFPDREIVPRITRALGLTMIERRQLEQSHEYSSFCRKLPASVWNREQICQIYWDLLSTQLPGADEPRYATAIPGTWQDFRDRGRESVKRMDYSNAVYLFGSACDQARRDAEPVKAALALAELALTRRELNSVESALRDAKKCLTQLGVQNAASALLRATSETVPSDEVIRLIDRIVQTAGDDGVDAFMKAVRVIGNCYLDWGHYAMASHCFVVLRGVGQHLTTLSDHLKAQSDHLIAQSDHFLGSVLLDSAAEIDTTGRAYRRIRPGQRADGERALAYFKRARDRHVKTGDDLSLARDFRQSANAHWLLCNQEDALEAQSEAQRYYESSGSKGPTLDFDCARRALDMRQVGDEVEQWLRRGAWNAWDIRSAEVLSSNLGGLGDLFLLRANKQQGRERYRSLIQARDNMAAGLLAFEPHLPSGVPPKFRRLALMFHTVLESIDGCSTHLSDIVSEISAACAIEPVVSLDDARVRRISLLVDSVR